MNDFDVLVIGGGPGGYAAALRAAQLGMKTALVEREKLGGTCLNVGCIPTKIFVKSASMVKSFEAMEGYGVKGVLKGFDLKQLQNKKNATVARLTGGVGSLLKGAGVEVIAGEAAFSDEKKVSISTGEGTRVVAAANVILATGTQPASLPILPFDGKDVLSSTDALSLTTLPKSMAIIGAGVVGMEFASIFAQLGVSVTVVEALDKILPAEDAAVATALQRSMEKQGVVFYTGAMAKKATRQAQIFHLKIAHKGSEKTIEVEKILVAVGRIPNTASLNLTAVGVATKRGLVEVNERMETTAKGIYAIGDIVPTIQLAHVAYDEGYVAAENIAGIKRSMHYNAVPRCIYTTPEVSAVGMTEEQAKAECENAKAYSFPFAAVGKALIEGSGEGFVKVIVDEQYGEILGYSMIGHGVGELIAGPTVAVAMEQTIEDLADVIHPHPSLSEAIKEVAMLAAGKPLHIRK